MDDYNYAWVYATIFHYDYFLPQDDNVVLYATVWRETSPGTYQLISKTTVYGRDSEVLYLTALDLVSAKVFI